MTDEVQKPVIVKSNQGALDTATAAARLALIVFSTAPAAALLVKKHDLVGLYDFFNTQPGIALGSALSGLAAIVFGLYKSWKRGRQMASVAGDRRTPDAVAQIKEPSNV